MKISLAKMRIILGSGFSRLGSGFSRLGSGFSRLGSGFSRLSPDFDLDSPDFLPTSIWILDFIFFFVQGSSSSLFTVLKRLRADRPGYYDSNDAQRPPYLCRDCARERRASMSMWASSSPLMWGRRYRQRGGEPSMAWPEDVYCCDPRG